MPTVRLCFLLAWLLRPTTDLYAQAHLDNGDFGVDVGASGVLLAAPAEGLWTVEGPRISFTSSTPEWYAIAYSDSRGRHEFAAEGTRKDWADRPQLRLLSFQADSLEARAITRSPEVEIQTTFHFDRTGPYLIVSVLLSNRGSETLRDLVYTREWHQPGEVGWIYPGDINGIRLAPAEICRLAWMLDDLPPGKGAGLGFSYQLATGPTTSSFEVPLALWTNTSHGGGLHIGSTNGVSFGDYDADGDPDLFACLSGNLWRNVDGRTWEFATDLDSVLPFAFVRYGSSFADYNQDGLPDIATEPRTGFGADDCMHLLKNLGGGPNFQNVAGNPFIIDVQPCGAHSETIVWGDVDGSGRLDLFLPVYPPWVTNGVGNFFLYNLGPLHPGGAYRFTEQAGPAGLDNPPGSARPEGAQMVDVDADGDLDLYSNGTLYQNRSTPGTAAFDALPEASSGIGLSTYLDEGSLFFDYDRDSDMDLAIVYTDPQEGVMIWENYGDGMFFDAGPIIDSFQVGLNLGISAADWDNDGDLDFTTRCIFRRNQMVETGQRHFTVATHNIPAAHVTGPTPAWADWDHDGDLDCAIGNYQLQGYFYENILYDASTPEDDRHHLRVRVMRDAEQLPQGTETEYGAIVEVRVVGEDFPRRQFLSSSGGYLNQDDYVLHFALPVIPLEALQFDLAVDFPSAEGVRRIDKYVQPLLGNLRFDHLLDRQITVFRSGRLQIDGCTSVPRDALDAQLRVLGPLARTEAVQPMSAPQFAAADYWVGSALQLGSEPVRIKEIAIDGQLGPVLTCGTDEGNVFVWDVTQAGNPTLVTGGLLAANSSARNRRHTLPVNIVLAENRSYRIVAHVTELRGSAFAGPQTAHGVTIAGGLSYTDLSGCLGIAAEQAAIDPAQAYLETRFSPDLGNRWTELGESLPSIHGDPLLTFDSTVHPGSPVSFTLINARPNSRFWLVVGGRRQCIEFAGGRLIPTIDLLVGPLYLDATGSLTLHGMWPPETPAGTTFHFQAWIDDDTGIASFAASNAVSATSPY